MAEEGGQRALDRLPVRFEANKGQTNSEVDFIARGPGYTLYLRRTEAVVALSRTSEEAKPAVVRMRLDGASTERGGVGSKRLPGVTNYLIGSDEQEWVTGVPSFGKVTYSQAYPGIDVVWYGDERQRIEYDFVVSPGADPSIIKLAFEGHSGLSLDDEGNLAIGTGGEELLQHRPVLYQEAYGTRRPVDGKYLIEGDRVGFEVGHYDPSLPLVIDPVLSYSSYTGGAGPDEVHSVTTGADGFAYVTGTTCSTDFALRAPYDSEKGGSCDAFVAKLDTRAAGPPSIVFATYLGGTAPGPDPNPGDDSVTTQYIYNNETGPDAGLDIAVDATGQIYVTGETTSYDFPITDNAFDRGCGTKPPPQPEGRPPCDYSTHSTSGLVGSISVTFSSDAFVTKLTHDGSGLAYSSYFGGSNGYVVNSSGSSNAPPPSPSGMDAGRAIVVDTAGVAFVTGSTSSTDFPTKGGQQSALQQSTYCVDEYNQQCGRTDNKPDAFLIKVDTAVTSADRLESLQYGSYFAGGTGVHGSLRDSGNDVALAPSPEAPGSVYIALNSYNAVGGPSAIVARVTTNSTSGGAIAMNWDQVEANALAVDQNGRLYVVGRTSSTDLAAKSPSDARPYQPLRSGPLSDPNEFDAFVASFEPSLNLRYATYLGGPGGTDSATAVAVTADGSPHVAGSTASPSFPVVNPLQSSRRGPSDAFVAKLTADGSGLEWSTYLGGGPTPSTLLTGDDRALGIALDSLNNAYVVGTTVSKTFPTADASQWESGGESDGFIAKIGASAEGRPHVTALEPAGGPPGTTVVITGSAFSGAVVRFGDVPASVTSIEPDKIIAVSPVPDNPGEPVNVSVVGPGGVSPSGSASRFAYHQGTWASAPAGARPNERVGTLTLLDGPGCRVVPPVTRPSFCGKVLLAGGTQMPSSASTATRLYDPQSGTWSALACGPVGPTCPAPLPRPFSSVTLATLLLNGNVLFTDPQTRTTNIYRPSTGTWATAGEVLNTHNNPTATLLDSGKVLLVGEGGIAAGVPPRPQAELFDPDAVVPSPNSAEPVREGLWRPTGELRVPRRGHTATKLGGARCGPHCGKVLVVGGASSGVTGGITDTAELYDPVTGLWADAGRTMVPRAGHTASLMADGRVLIAGGNSPGGNPLYSAEIFDPTAAGTEQAWRPTGRMSRVRANDTAVALPGGQVLIAGGDVGNSHFSDGSSELFDPSLDGGLGAWQPSGNAAPGATTAYGLRPFVMLSGRSDRYEHDASICGTRCGQVLFEARYATAASSAHLFTPPPWVSATSASFGPTEGGKAITVTGGGFSETDVVYFGRRPAPTTFVSHEELIALSPPAPAGVVPLRVVRDRVGVGTAKAPFTIGGPGGVTDLAAAAVSTTEVRLTFSAPGAGGGAGPPARSYVIKQSTSPIGPENFDEAKSLCTGGVCGGYEPGVVGDDLSLDVGGLVPDTMYHYALKAMDDNGALGAISNAASAMTHSVDPGGVTDLEATPVSSSEISLSFGAAGSNADKPPPAGDYLIRYSTAPIDGGDSFDAAASVCQDGTCSFEPKRVRELLVITASGLSASTTYYFALRAKDGAGNLGPISAPVAATTLRPGCMADPGEPAAGQVSYRSGYSLVGLPGGTKVNAHSSLFSWFDKGAGGTYAESPGDEPLEEGRGYWAWSSCPRLVEMRGAGSPSASFALGAFHASMVGNPSGVAPAEISGHDFTARWRPAMNGGSGGYAISRYREPQELAVGEGIWAFSYASTTLLIQQR